MMCVLLDSNTDNQYSHGFEVTFWPPFGGTGPTTSLLINPKKSPVKQQVQGEEISSDPWCWCQIHSEVTPAVLPMVTSCPAHGDILPCLCHPHPWERAAIAFVTAFVPAFAPQARANRAVLTQH